MIDMKKKFSLSKVTVVMLLLLVVLVVYVFAYFVPAQSELNMLRAELAVFNAEANIYKQYLSDSTPLENDIQSIQDQIDELNDTGYINDSTVSFEISDAIQRYSISLSSVSLDTVTTYDGHRVLPMNLTMTGNFEDVLKFIDHFENDEEGSYLVRGSAIEISGNTTNASLVIYLCTPDL